MGRLSSAHRFLSGTAGSHQRSIRISLLYVDTIYRYYRSRWRNTLESYTAGRIQSGSSVLSPNMPARPAGIGTCLYSVPYLSFLSYREAPDKPRRVACPHLVGRDGLCHHRICFERLIYTFRLLIFNEIYHLCRLSRSKTPYFDIIYKLSKNKTPYFDIICRLTHFSISNLLILQQRLPIRPHSQKERFL